MLYDESIRTLAAAKSIIKISCRFGHNFLIHLVAVQPVNIFKKISLWNAALVAVEVAALFF